MSEQPGEHVAHGAAWRRLTRERPWYRKLASQPLAEAKVVAPDGKIYLVRVRKNSALVGPEGVGGADPLSTVLGLVKANVEAAGETGWQIEVLTPPTGWGRETVLYAQPVGARVIVVDVVLAITSALERGDKLWPEDAE